MTTPASSCSVFCTSTRSTLTEGWRRPDASAAGPGCGRGCGTPAAGGGLGPPAEELRRPCALARVDRRRRRRSPARAGRSGSCRSYQSLIWAAVNSSTFSARANGHELVRRVRSGRRTWLLEESERPGRPVGVLPAICRRHPLLHRRSLGLGERGVLDDVGVDVHRLVEVLRRQVRSRTSVLLPQAVAISPPVGVEEVGDLLGRSRVLVPRGSMLHREVAQAVGLRVLGGEPAEGVHLHGDQRAWW